MTTTTNITKKVQELEALEKELKAAQAALKAAQTALKATKTKTACGKALAEAQEAEMQKAEEKVEETQAAYDAVYDAVYDDVREYIETAVTAAMTAQKEAAAAKLLQEISAEIGTAVLTQTTPAQKSKKELRRERNLAKLAFKSTKTWQKFDIETDIAIAEAWEKQAEADWRKTAIHKMALVAADRAEASIKHVDLTGYDLVDDPWYVEKQKADELESFGYTPHSSFFVSGDNFTEVPVETCDVYRKQEDNEDHIFFVFNKSKYVDYIEDRINEFAQRICKYESNNYFGNFRGILYSLYQRRDCAV